MSDPIFRLMERHQQLDTRLSLARARRWTDPFEIARLKKLKLALKDRIAEIDAKRAAGIATVPTTIGLERATNPFVRADTAQVRAAVNMPTEPANEVFGEVRKRKDNFK